MPAVPHIRRICACIRDYKVANAYHRAVSRKSCRGRCGKFGYLERAECGIVIDCECAGGESRVCDNADFRREGIRLRVDDVPLCRRCVGALREDLTHAAYIEESGAYRRRLGETGGGRIRGRIGDNQVKSVWEWA